MLVMLLLFRVVVPLPGRDDDGRQVILLRTGEITEITLYHEV